MAEQPKKTCEGAAKKETTNNSDKYIARFVENLKLT